MTGMFTGDSWGMGRLRGEANGLSGAGISVAELLEIRSEVEKQALETHGSRFDDPNRRPTSVERLETIVAAEPRGKPMEHAAWIVRALVMLQPFPDRNGLTGVLAAQLLLGRHDINFRPSGEASEAFHQAVSEMRYLRMNGYGDAPPSVLSEPDDEMLATCLAFIQDNVEKAP